MLIALSELSELLETLRSLVAGSELLAAAARALAASTLLRALTARRSARSEGFDFDWSLAVLADVGAFESTGVGATVGGAIGGVAEATGAVSVEGFCDGAFWPAAAASVAS